MGKHDKPESEAIKHEPPAPKAVPVAPPEQKTNDILAGADELPSYDGGYTKLQKVMVNHHTGYKRQVSRLEPFGFVGRLWPIDCFAVPCRA